MATVVTNLKQRFVAELPLWHLSLWQLFLRVVWAAWPWLVEAVLPGHEVLAFAPVFVFLPIAYIVGNSFVALFPSISFAYPLGISLTIFMLLYLCIVSWRQRRVQRTNP